jgi:hypothetical protein
MIFLPFLPKLDAMEILEAEYEGEMARAELEAELGSGFFVSGASSWDASAMARMAIQEMQEDFEQSEDGPLHMAKVEAAKFMQSATRDLAVASVEESRDPVVFTFGASVIPEYRLDFKRSAPAAPSDDLPF